MCLQKYEKKSWITYFYHDFYLKVELLYDFCLEVELRSVVRKLSFARLPSCLTNKSDARRAFSILSLFDDKTLFFHLSS